MVIQGSLIAGTVGMMDNYCPAGMFIDRRGTIYVPAGTGNRQLEDMKVKVIGADGKMKNNAAVHIQNARLGGVAVDSRGNIRGTLKLDSLDIKGKQVIDVHSLELNLR